MSSKSESCFPDMRTELKFEKHAASKYTLEIFDDVQEEIARACYVCRATNITIDDVVSTYEVDDRVDGVFTVIYNSTENSFTCNCKNFIKVGLLCCHIFYVFKDLKLKCIPDKYVVSRWTKNVCSDTVGNPHIEKLTQAAPSNDTQFVLNQLHYQFYRCLSLVDGNNDHMSSLLKVLQDFEEEIEIEEGNDKNKMFERFYGSAIPKDVSVMPPVPVKNKGSGRRIKSSKENALRVSKKPPRKCSNCKEMTNHDARNCPNPQA